MEPRIGIRFEHKDKEGVILQSGKDLPKNRQTGNEGNGPFFGVNYENVEYIWYNYEGMKTVLNNSRVHNYGW